MEMNLSQRVNTTPFNILFLRKLSGNPAYSNSIRYPNLKKYSDNIICSGRGCDIPDGDDYVDPSEGPNDGSTEDADADYRNDSGDNTPSNYERGIDNWKNNPCRDWVITLIKS